MREDMDLKREWRTLAAVLVLAMVYFGAGKLGLSWAYIHPSASAVWPPSGIALAALLFWGYRLWPGIFLGAFLVNITTHGSLATTLGIATGNTLEALLAAWSINRFADGAGAFERARTTFKFVFIAAIFSTIASATLGVTSLTLGGFARWEKYPAIWLTWWLGDAVGDLIIAPLLLIWLTLPQPRWKPERVIEAIGLLFALLLTGYYVFAHAPSFSAEYILLLPLLWASFRFGPRGAVTSAFLVSAIALAGTMSGTGPFAQADPNQSLLSLQSFLGTVALAALVLAAAISENRRAEQRLQAQAAISRILSASPPLRDAARQIVEVLCERAGWELGAVWSLDRSAGELYCVDIWHRPSLSVPEFEAETRNQRFLVGSGLPGQVLHSGRPFWIPDVTADEHFLRAPAAIKAGLRSAFGFPIKSGTATLGVIDCFSREIREPDEHFLEMVEDIGVQIGQFIERKRAEDELRAERARLREVTEVTPVMLTQCSRDFRFKFVNHAHAAMFGCTPEQITGKRIVEVIGAEAFDAIRPHVEAVLQGRRVEYESEIRYHGAGNRFVRVTYVPEIDPQGRVQGWIASISDITERKRAEQLLSQAKDALVKANEELERRVAERTVELASANSALVKTIEQQKSLEEQLRQAQKMEIVGTLAGGVAHDFNNILNVVGGYAALIQQSATDEQTRQALQVIANQVERGATVVRQLLTVARKAETQLAPTDSNELVLNFTELVKQSFPKTIAIRLDLDPHLPLVLADRNQMGQALLNICVNARDAMPKGGVLTIKTELIAGRPVESPLPGTAHVAIVIRDTGVGMDNSVQARIFEPFFTTKSIGEGTGLGLAIVYGIVKEHGGIIGVESATGQGTTFRISLPTLEGKTETSRDPPGPSSPQDNPGANHRGTVLVVEDDEAMALLLKRVLPRAGLSTFIAADGAQAIEFYRDNKDKIDVVLLDLGLPKISGRDVLYWLKEHDPKVKIIVATGYLDPELKSEILSAGVTECINKPYAVKELVTKIGHLIDNSGRSAELK